MYCKNCGNKLDPNAAICVKCGLNKGQGDKFCANCGGQTLPNASVCMNCGYAIKHTGSSAERSAMVVLLLAIFLGNLGIHCFYLGYNGKGVAQLLISLLLFWTVIAPIIVWVWALVQGINAVQGKLMDADGRPLGE